jgi:hypothetical protein
MTTYIYEDQEVELTGRVASRKNFIRTLKVNTTEKVLDNVTQLVEVKPVDDISSWTKWVKMEQLYTVEITNE